MSTVVTQRYKIADVTFSLTLDASLEHPYLKDFRNEEDSPEFSVTVKSESYTQYSSTRNCLYSSDIIDITQTDEGFHFLCKTQPQPIFCDYSTITRQGIIFLPSDYSSHTIVGQYTYSDYIFFILKELFFYHCLNKEMLPLHSSSIIYDGRAYLFSAPSGTGKTTHTDFWCNLFGATILDGDVTMLSIRDDKVYAHGLPWCGTSGRYINATVPLGNVIFIKRADAISIGECDMFNAVINLCARSFAPNWTKELASKVLAVAQKIATLSPCLSMKIQPIPETAQMAKEYIDKQKKQA